MKNCNEKNQISEIELNVSKLFETVNCLPKKSLIVFRFKECAGSGLARQKIKTSEFE